MYSLLTFTSLISIFFFVEVLKKNQLKSWIGYIISGVLMVYSHFFGLFILVTQILLFFLYSIKNRDIAKRFFIAQSTIIFFNFPLLPRILTVSSTAGWIPKPTFLMLVGTFFQFSNSSLVSFMLFSILSIGGIMKISQDYLKKLGSAIKCSVRLKPDWGSFAIVFCLLWLGFPIVLSFLISLVIKPIFLMYYLILVSPAFYLFVAKGLTAKKWKIQTILILIILLDSTLVTTAYNLNTQNDQWREVAMYIDENAKPTDLILINSIGASSSISMQLPFEFYFKSTNIVYGCKTVYDLNEIVNSSNYSNIWLIIFGFTDPLNLGLFAEQNQLKNELNKTWRILLCKEYMTRSILNSISFIKYPLFNVVDEKIIIYYYGYHSS